MFASRYVVTLRRVKSRALRLSRTMSPSDSTSSGNSPAAFADLIRWPTLRHSARRHLGRRRSRQRKILQFEHAARDQHVFARRHPACRRLVYLDRVGDSRETESPQLVDAVFQNGILLAQAGKRQLGERHALFRQSGAQSSYRATLEETFAADVHGSPWALAFCHGAVCSFLRALMGSNR